jgi:hypothetical protein
MSLHSDILRILDNAENMSQHGRRSYWTDQIILMVRQDAAQRVKARMFDKDGRLHSCGSSIDAGGGIEFCCTCDSQYQAAADIIAVIEGDSE